MALKLGAMLLGLALVVGAVAGPISLFGDETPSQCARTCPEGLKFFYAAGKTYEYRYETNLKTSIPGATEEHSSLHMSATVQLEVLSKCEWVLRLSHVTLEDSRNGQRHQVNQAWDFKQRLQENPLRFAFLDGRIDNVCPTSNEDTWVLNVKRAIISSLQHTLANFDKSGKITESDISGTCEVEYKKLPSGWSTRHVMKTKDVLTCTDRHGFESAFQGTPYRVPSKLQSLPVMKTTHECKQTITKSGRIQEVDCQEVHVFRPFSKSAHGATAEVDTKLVFQRELSSVKPFSGTYRRASLAFEHKLQAEDQSKNRREAQEAMRKLCVGSKTDIRPEVPRLFSTLVRELRKLDTTSLKDMHKSITTNKICSKAEKFFRDATLILGTTASVSLIRDLIIKKDIRGKEADLWMTSLAFVPKPTKGMLSEIKPLLTDPSTTSNAGMAISSLVNTYCRINPRCGEEREVKDIVKIFEDNLKYNCRITDKTDYSKIMMSLKGIGNTGHAESAINTLNRCFLNKDAPNEIRVASMNAFRRISCSAERDELLTMFLDTEADSELRITAYLALMQCPTSGILSQVKLMLEKEEVNQVGSFVWTHLTNLMETSAPLKQDIRQILDSESLKKEFDLDKRKFSRNIEWSAFSHTINMGANVESNVIWSSQSYIPRSAMVNLTIDMFGQSVNLIELGGRVEGLEKYLESIFTDVEDNKVNRPKRDIIGQENLANVDKKFNLNAAKDPKGSYYIKVFGSEISYDDFRGLDVSAIKDKFNYLNWLVDLATEHKFDFTKSIMFLDSTVTIPTIAGLPLTLSVDGVATVDIKVTTKLDLRKLWKAPRSMLLRADIKPSAAIEICGEMAIDAFVTKAGMRLVSTTHTSTAADGTMELREGKMFNFDLNLPKDKMEIASSEIKFLIIHRDQEYEQKMITDDRVEKSKCLGGYLTKALGLELCGEVAFPAIFSKKNAPWFPFNGPSKVKLELNKKDTFKGYHFEAKYLQNKVRQGRTFEITDVAKVSFNTPGSRIDRELTFDFALNRAKMASRMNIRTPWKKMDLNGAITNQDDLKRFTARLIMDDKDEYSFVSELQIDNRKVLKYTPRIEITIPNRDTITLTGSAIYRAKRRWGIDLSLKNLFRKPAIVKGTIDKFQNNRRFKMKTDLLLKCQLVDGRVKAYTDLISNKAYISDIQVDYKLPDGKSDSVVLSNKCQLTPGALKKAKITSNMVSKRWSDYMYDVRIDLAMSKKILQTNLDASLGKERSKKLQIIHVASDKSKGEDKVLEYNLKLNVPHKSIAWGVTLDHLHNKNELRSIANVKYAPRDQGRFEVHLKKESHKPLKLEGSVSLQYPGREMKFTESLHEFQPKQYRSQMLIQLDKYQQITIDSTYKKHAAHEFTSKLNIPDMDPIEFKLSANEDIRNFRGKAEGLINRKTYSVETSWLKKPAHIRGDLDMVYDQRRITANGEVARKAEIYNTKMDLKWDANRDPMKAFSANGAVTLSYEKPAIQMKASWYPRKFIELTSDMKMTRPGYFGSTSTYEAAAQFTSSFLDPLEIEVKHENKANEVTTSGFASWKQGKKVEGTFSLKRPNGWKSIKAETNLRTPFRGFRKINHEVSYNINGKTVTANTKFQWERKHIVFFTTGTADLNRPFLDASVNFKSPFENFEELSFIGRHEYTSPTKCTTRIDVKWAPHKQITYLSNMEHSRNGWYINNSGDMRITTPYRPYTNNIVTWRHNNDADIIKSHLEIENPSVKIAFDVDASQSLSWNKRKIEIKSYLHTPVRNMNINFKHENERRTWKNIKTEATAMYAPGKVVHYEHEVHVVPYKYVTKKAKFTSPFTEDITLELETRQDGNKYSTHKELKWAPNKKIAWDGDLTINGYAFTSETRFTSPYENLERLALKLSHQKQATLWVTRAEFEHPGKKSELDLKLGWEDMKKVSMDLKTPYEWMKPIALDLEVNGVIRDFEVKGMFNYEPLQGKITMNTKVDTSNLDDLKVTFDMRSPFRKVQYIRSIVSHKKQGWAKYICDVSLEYPQNKMTLNNFMILRSWKNFNTRTRLQYQPGSKAELTTSFRVNPKIEGKVSLRTPFRNFEEMNVMFDHEGSLTNFKSNAELMYMTNKKMTITSEFSKNYNNIRGTATFTSPIDRLEKIHVDIKHNGRLTSFKNSGLLEFDNHKVSGESQFRLNGNNLRANAHLQLPIKGYRRVSMNAFHNGDLTNFRNNGFFEIAGRKFSGETEFHLVGNKLSTTAKVHTPINGFRTLSMNVEHSGDYMSFSNNGEFVLNNKKVSGETEFSLKGTHLHAKAKIQTPMDRYETISIIADHHGPWNQFKNSGEIDISGKKLSGEAEFTLSGNDLHGEIKVKTGREILSMTADHHGPWTGFKNSGEIVVPGKKLAGEAEFTLSGNDLHAAVKVQTPLEGYETMSLNADHNGPWNDFKNKVSVNVAEKKVIGETEFTLYNNNNLRAAAKLQTPVRDYETLSVLYTHSGSLKNFKCNGIIKIGDDTIKAATHYRISARDITGKFQVETPYEKLDFFSVGFNHNGFLRQFKNNAKIQYSDRKLEASSEFSKNGNSVSGKLEAKMPFRKMRSMTVTFNHDGTLTDFKSNGEILYSGKQITSTVEFKKQRNNLNGKFIFKSPCPYLDSVDMSFNHNGAWDNFRNSAEVTYSGNKVTTTNNFLLRNKRLQGKFQINTPFASIRKLALHLDHNGPWTDFGNSASLHYSGKTIKVSSELKTEGPISGKFDLSTPYSKLSSVNLEFEHNGQLHNFNNKVELKVNGEKGEVINRFQKTGKSLTGRFQLRTPFRNAAKAITLNFNHDGTLTHFKNNGMLRYPGCTVQMNSNFRKNGQSLTGLLDLKTPEWLVSSAMLKFSHDGPINSFRNNGEVTFRGKTSTYNGQFQKNGNRINGEFMLENTVLERLSCKFNHHGDLMNFKHGGELGYFGKSITYNGEFQHKPESTNGKLSLETPYTKRSSVEFNRDGSFTDFKTSGAVSYGFKTIKGNMAYQKTGNRHNGNLHFQTPFTGFESMTLTGNHRGRLHNFQTIASAELSGKKINSRVEYRFTKGPLTGKVHLTTPFNILRSLDMLAHHEGTKWNFKNHGSVAMNGKMVSGNSEFEWEGSNINAKAGISTPQNDYSIDIQHSGPMTNFNNKAIVQYLGNRIQTSASYHLTKHTHASDHIMNLQVSTPYTMLRNGELSVDFHKSANKYSGKIGATHNNAKKLDLAAEYRTGSQRNIIVTMKHPRPMTARVNYGKTDSDMTGDATFNWNTRTRDSNVRFEGSLKQVKDYYTTKKAVIFKTILPRRTVGLSTGYEAANNRLQHWGEFQWNNAPDNKIAYKLDLSKAYRRGENTYNGLLDYTSMATSFSTNLKHVANSGRRYITELRHMPKVTNEQLVLKSEVLLNKPNYKTTLTIKHPRFQKEATASMEANIDLNRRHFSGKGKVDYEDHTFETAGKLADESSYGNSKYVAMYHLAHPQSHLDFTFNGHVENSKKVAAADMKIDYKTSRTRRVHSLASRAALDKLRKKLELSVVSPMKEIKMAARKVPADEGIHRFTLESTVDGQNTKHDFSINTNMPHFDLKAYYTPENFLHMSAKYVNPSHMQFELYRNHDGSKIVEASVAFKLKSSRLLNGKLYWRPSIVKDIKETIEKAAQRMQDQLSDSYKSFSEEVAIKSRDLRRAMEPLGEMYSAIYDEMRPILQTIRKEYNRIYWANEFYVKDISTWCADAYIDMSSKIAANYREMRVAYAKLASFLAERKAQLIDLLNRFSLGDFMDRVKATYDKYNRKISGMRMPKWDSVSDKIKETIDRLREHPRVQAYVNKIIEYRNLDYFRPIRQRWNTAKNTLNGHWETISKNPQAVTVLEWLKNAIVQSKWAYEYYEIEKTAINNLKSLKENAEKMLKSQIKAMLHDYLHIEKTRFTTWSPRNGRIEGQIYIPVPLKNLKTLPNIPIQKYWSKFQEMVVKYIPNRHILMDMYYTYKPTSDINNWIPPFKSHAMLAGSQHYMTFDKKFYEFEGDCSYLLARDFINGKFSAVVNYKKLGKTTRKSLTILSSGEQVEIFPDFKVLVNGRHSELPIQKDDTTVVRRGNMVYVENEKGVKLECDLYHDRCTLMVTGWYFGKTGGLFGTFNNEPSDDFTKSDRSRTSDITDFANSWVVGKTCRSTNKARDVNPKPDSRRYKICASYFMDESSPFRPCFKQVKPEPYMKMCFDHMDISSNRMVTDLDVCDVASYYVDNCRRQYVPVKVPSKCVRCELSKKKTFNEGQTITLSDDSDNKVPKSADVLFVVEEKRCNKAVSVKLKEIASRMDKAMRLKGINHNRFGIVAFGGHGVHDEPHSHTMDGGLFTRWQKLNLAIRTLDFSKDGYNTDALLALKFATRYPFRAGVSKTIIVIPCSDCSEMAVSYPEIEQALLRHSIRAHVLTHKDFQLKAKSPKTSFIFGVDNTGVFTHKNVKDKKLIGDRELRLQVGLPKDLCIALAQVTDGSIFSAARMSRYRPYMQKKFVDVLTRLAAKKAVPSECQICECVADEASVGTSVCRSCTPTKTIYSIVPGQTSPSFTTKDKTKFDLDFEEYMKYPAKKYNVKKA